MSVIDRRWWSVATPSSSWIPRSSAADLVADRAAARSAERVLALDAEPRVEHPLGPAAVVRQDQQALAVLVEPADRVEARAVGHERRRDEVEDGRRRRGGPASSRSRRPACGGAGTSSARRSRSAGRRPRSWPSPGRPAGRASPAARRPGRGRPRSGPRSRAATRRRRPRGPSGAARAASGRLVAGRRRRASASWRRRRESAARRPSSTSRAATSTSSGGSSSRRRQPEPLEELEARPVEERPARAHRTGRARRRAGDGAASGPCSRSRRRGSARSPPS